VARVIRPAKRPVGETSPKETNVFWARSGHVPCLEDAEEVGLDQAAFKITFRPMVAGNGPGDSPPKSGGWLARLFEPEPPGVEAYAVTVLLSGRQEQKHADRDLLRTAFRTAAAHGGAVQVRCSGEPSEHLRSHIEDLRAEFDEAGLRHRSTKNEVNTWQQRQC